MKIYSLIIPPGYPGSAASISGGCGSDGALFDLVPDNFIGVDILECCRIHDFLYTVGGSEEDKIKADRMFRTNLIRSVFNDSNLIFRSTNLALARLYYKAVCEFGHSSFNYRKDK